MTPKLSVRFYRHANGNEPVADWLRALPRHARKAIGEDIKTVELGWPLGMPLVRKLEPGLWEIRGHVPDGIARMFFTTLGREMVLLHAFVKKSDRTPRSDMSLAKARRDEVHRANR